MGTILMKASFDDLTVENMHQYCFDHLSGSELRNVCSVPEYRQSLVKSDLNHHMQNGLNETRRLSKDECISIIENSSSVWSMLLNLHQYDIELLRNNAHKLPLSYVDRQDSLDHDFVAKYANNMDMTDFVRSRVEKNTISEFLDIPLVLEKYMRLGIIWNTKRQEVKDFINHFKPNAVPSETEKFVNDLFDKPVNEETLRTAYSDQERASHTVSTVVSYFINNSSKHAFETWDEYTDECISNQNYGLANAWFNDFYRPAISEFCGIEF